MRHFATALVAVASLLPALAAAEATTKILQQRTPDGSILLTDQPSPGAKTERSWQVTGQDRAAERQRAIDVKAEANLVSERIQRSIDSQRRADDEARMRLAYLQMERDRAAAPATQDGIGYAYGGGFGRPIPFRASRHPGLPVGDIGIMDPTGTRGEMFRGGHAKPRGSGSRGNR
jgi:hypothetical protein